MPGKPRLTERGFERLGYLTVPSQIFKSEDDWGGRIFQVNCWHFLRPGYCSKYSFGDS
jgi:hypothetical protein